MKRTTSRFSQTEKRQTDNMLFPKELSVGQFCTDCDNLCLDLNNLKSREYGILDLTLFKKSKPIPLVYFFVFNLTMLLLFQIIIIFYYYLRFFLLLEY